MHARSRCDSSQKTALMYRYSFVPCPKPKRQGGPDFLGSFLRVQSMVGLAFADEQIESGMREALGVTGATKEEYVGG